MTFPESYRTTWTGQLTAGFPANAGPKISFTFNLDCS